MRFRITRPPEAFGQHMLQNQPQELRTGNGPQFPFTGPGVAVTETHLPVFAGDN